MAGRDHCVRYRFHDKEPGEGWVGCVGYGKKQSGAVYCRVCLVRFCPRSGFAVITDPVFYVIASVAVLINGVSKSGFGGGMGVLSVPLMALVIAPAQAAAVLLPILVMMDLLGVLYYRRKWDPVNLRILLPAMIFGVFLGMLLFRYLSDDHIRILVGSIAVAFTLDYVTAKRERPRRPPSVVRGGFWGILAGFVSFGVHAGGPPVSVYLLPQKLDKTLFVGTTVILFTVVNLVKVVPYAMLGQLTIGNLYVSLLLLPLAPLGIWLGIAMHHRVNERWFYRICYLFLAITGGKLLWDGAWGAWAATVSVP